MTCARSLGVDRAHVVNTDRADEGFDINRFGDFTGDGVARTRVFLLTGHGGDAVVQNDGDQLAAVVGNVQQRVDAGVEEGRIPDRRDDARFSPSMVSKICCAPCPRLMLAPMQTVVSMALYGAPDESV